jgi:hypothetical protein
MITGRFEGFNSYQDWVVYLQGFNYRSVVYRVDPSGAFQLTAVNIPPGQYLLFFGKMKTKALGTLKIKVESLRTHLGIIPAGQ